MRRVLILTSDPGPSGPASLAAQLAEGLPRDRFAVGVGVIGDKRGPLTGKLREAGIEPAVIPWRWPLDAPGWFELLKAVSSFAPDVVHAIGAGAVRLAHLAGAGRLRIPIVATGADRAETGVVRWLTVRALRKAARVTARTQAELERYRAAGAPADRLALVPPGVPQAPPPPDGAEFRKSLGIPPTGRLVLAAGRFDAAAGLISAVWAFDVVRYVRPHLYLVLVGDGPERGRLERFARSVGRDDYRVRFAGPRDDFPALARLADVVWVTHDRGGVVTALEALAAGVPVIAARTPDLAAVIEDGVTGRLYPPADRVRLAAVTHDLFADPAATARLATAGRELVRAEFPVARLVGRFSALYDDVLGNHIT